MSHLTLEDVLSRVDAERISALWVTPDRARAQQLIRWVKQHHLEGDAKARTWVAVGFEGYTGQSGGRLYVVPATAPDALRGITSDLVVLPGGKAAYLPTATYEALRPALVQAEVAGW